MEQAIAWVRDYGFGLVSGAAILFLFLRQSVTQARQQDRILNAALGSSQKVERSLGELSGQVGRIGEEVGDLRNEVRSLQSDVDQGFAALPCPRCPDGEVVEIRRKTH